MTLVPPSSRSASGSGGGLSSIQTIGPLGSTQATLDFTGIPATATHLYLVANMRDTDPGGSALVTFNGDTGANYDWGRTSQSGATVSGANSTGDTRVTGSAEGSGDAPSGASMLEVFVSFYALTAFRKVGYVRTYRDVAGVPAYEGFNFCWRNTAAVTRITVTSTTLYVVGSVAVLYGMT